MPTIVAKLIEAGVKNLHEFGYPHCDEKNILTDKIYSAFFKSMLEDNRGKGVDKEIDSILLMMQPKAGKPKPRPLR